MPQNIHPSSPTQRFLFLQGVCSPFFARLANALRAHGHVVRKINFTVGDRMYWGSGNADSFRGSMSELSEFYSKQFNSHGITDIVVFGDCRPVHRPAIDLAKGCGVRIHVFEEGYFRPYWITLERNGVNGYSSLPTDPNWYRAKAESVPSYDNGQPFRSPFWKRAAYDVGYNFWAGLNPVLHPGVKSHVPYNPMTEYLGYLSRALRVRARGKHDLRVINQLVSDYRKSPYYLFPLQLATDSQIVCHSPYRDITHAIETVMTSFATHADSRTLLAIKVHPLDPGLVKYENQINELAKKLEITGRIRYLESGNLPKLLTFTHGVVTVNSTVGASALLHHRPTIALGSAIYSMPGLTYQGPLNNFWASRPQPDSDLFRAFRNVAIHLTQINGGFYSAEGINTALKECVTRLSLRHQPQ